MNPQYAFQDAPMNMPMFAGGGLAPVAQNLASQGRQGDSMLVHMSPQEVGGLQALAQANGTNLTTNPRTGMPEAFKLRDILPAIAGFALAPLTAGTSLAFLGTPMGAGLAMGGVEALRTGDLGRGLMAGLGAYGGAGLGSALGATGAGMVGEAAQLAGPGTVAAPASGFSAVGEGVKALGQPGGVSNFASNLGTAFPSTMGKVGATIGLTAPLMPQPEMPAMPEPEKSNYEGPYVPTPRDVRFKSPEDRSTSEFPYFNPSNPVPGYGPMPIYAAEGGSINPTIDANINQISAMSDGYALGGLTALAGGGRYLQGPGDGTGDSIPATIGNKQPARLADGEFVIDARTVSEIGNGSSNAGAKKLYAMMDRVHGARKKAKRGQDTKAERYMPA